MVTLPERFVQYIISMDDKSGTCCKHGLLIP